MPRRADSPADEDQTPWRAPGPQGFLSAPFGAPVADGGARAAPDGGDAPGEREPPGPARPDRDADSERMRRVIVFLLVLACMGLVPLIGLGLRLAR